MINTVKENTQSCENVVLWNVLFGLAIWTWLIFVFALLMFDFANCRKIAFCYILKSEGTLNPANLLDSAKL